MSARIALDPIRLLAEARELLADTVQLRRRIHAEPEIGLDLPKTQAKVLDALSGLDLMVETGEKLSSVVATLAGDGEGPTILLRGDMDALPMTEETGETFASTVPGAMHACGHDSHVAMLVGAARLLHERRHDLRGNVKFMFQPGEEGHHGAKFCIEEGLLENPTVDAAFALHISPNHKSGTLATKPGPLLASADELYITVSGQGGHASAPHLATDPIPVACEIVTALQTHITRTVNIFEPAVLTIAKISAGTTDNVIPEQAELVGTLRTVSDKTREQVLASVPRVVEGVASAHGCRGEFVVERGYGPTVNDDDFARYTLDVLSDLVGAERTVEMTYPAMAAEDWSYVLNRVPGAMAMLGVCPPDLEPSHAHACHSNHMRIDEDAMATGIAAHAAMALSYLG
ncbi:MAG: M20 family metallopeptidase [Acidimicrobiia bacterium]|nr:M20 family metallopeptidase [Acidimicrobiia bacterium]